MDHVSLWHLLAGLRFDASPGIGTHPNRNTVDDSPRSNVVLLHQSSFGKQYGFTRGSELEGLHRAIYPQQLASIPGCRNSSRPLLLDQLDFFTSGCSFPCSTLATRGQESPYSCIGLLTIIEPCT